jgi:hypothetical protein
MMDNITKLNWDMEHKKVVAESPTRLWQQEVSNDLNVVATSHLIGKYDDTTESHFSDSVSDKITANNVAELDIPLVADDTLTLTWEHVSSQSAGGSMSTTESDSFVTDLPLPPHSKGMAVVMADRATVTVPYEFAGTFVYKSGARLPVHVNGIYTGTNSFNVRVQFQLPPKDPKAQVGLSLSKPMPLHFTVVKKETIRKSPLALRSSTR